MGRRAERFFNPQSLACRFFGPHCRAWSQANGMSFLTVNCICYVLVQSCMACTFTTFSHLYLAFPTGCLILEVNSIPLHLRRIMRYHQIDRSSLLYRFNLAILLITFVIFRFIPVSFMEIYVILHGQDQYLPYYLFGVFGLGGMVVVNVVLFLSLFNAELGRDKNPQLENT